MCSKFTQRQVCLMQQLRKLWEQHVVWTRFFIISTASELADLEAVTRRLLRNPGDFGAALLPFYGVEVSNCFKELLTEHLKIGGDFVTAAKEQDSEKANMLRKKWYENADEIASFLAKINPFWKEREWRDLLYDHLEMTEKQAMLRFKGRFSEDIQVFDKIEQEALKMADCMAEGILKQFCIA